MAEPVTATYSISFRLQRTTTEVAFVSVPVTGDLVIEGADGKGSLDVPKLIRRAVELGSTPGIAWQPESQEVQPHPIQTPPPRSEGPN